MSRTRVDVVEIIDTQDHVIQMQSELIKKLYNYIEQNSTHDKVFGSDIGEIAQMQEGIGAS